MTRKWSYCLFYLLNQVLTQASYQGPLENIKFRLTGHATAFLSSLNYANTVTYVNAAVNEEKHQINLPVLGDEGWYLQGDGDFTCGNVWKSDDGIHPNYGNGEYLSTCLPIDVEFNFTGSSLTYSVTTNIELYTVFCTVENYNYNFVQNLTRLMVGDFAFA